MRPVPELLDAHFDDALDDAGLDELQAWLRADEANRVRFLREGALRHELRQVLALPVEAARCVPARVASGAGGWRWAAAAALVLVAVLGWLSLAGMPRDGVRVEAVDGGAMAQGAGADTRHRLRIGEAITAGTLITTGTDGEVGLRLGDGSRLVLGGGGALRRGMSGGPAWLLDGGHLEAAFAHQPEGRPCILRTPCTDVVVVGTSFDCAVAGGATHLRMEEGCVRLRPAAGREVECRTGQLAVADTAGIRLREAEGVLEGQTAAPMPPTAPGIVAFPGATGFGASSLGGRGGRVIAVTSLADDGSGSLRMAVGERGARIIVFRVSGTIALRTPLRIQEGRLTIAGQTAPGAGICLRDAAVEVGAWDSRSHQAHPCDDVVIRHLRLRPGDLGPDGQGGSHVNGLTIAAGRRIIIDHCSISWSGNKAIRSGIDGSPDDLVRDLTIQDCLIAEALHAPAGGDGPRGFALLLGGTDVSLHRNVLAHVYSYAPKPCGSGVCDCRNNLIYNWIHRGCGYINDAADDLRLNYLGNLLKTGPDAPPGPSLAFRSLKGSADICVHDLAFLRPDGSCNSSIPALMTSTTGQRLTSRAYACPPCPLMPARELVDRLLPTVGACRPLRDAVDARICDEVRAGTGGVIPTVRALRSWPELRSAPPPVDSDGDGLPDDWERSHGLDPQDPSDGGRVGADGLTALDRYLAELARPGPGVSR